MADSKDLQTQLELQAAINDAIKKRNGLLKQQGSILSNQLKMSMEMCDAMGCKNLDGMADRLNEISDALSGASDAAEEMSDSIEDAATNAAQGSDSASGGFKKVTSNIGATHGAAIGMFKGLAKGFAGGLMDLKSVASAFFSVTKAVFSIGKAIFAIPFGIISSLVDMTNEYANGTQALREAYEELRGTLGDMAYGEGAAAVDMFKGFQEQGSNLAGTGLSLRQIFGTGTDGLAAALGEATKTLAEMGSAGQEAFKTLDRGAKVQVAMITKALDISSESMNDFALNARAAGMTLDKYLVNMSKNTLRAAKQFGISAKFLTKDLAEMSKSFVEFGSMSQEEMLQTAVYARKLGTDINGLKGIMDKFSDFESTQSAVSELNQTLGIQLDTMKMLKAENPADMIDQMRESFFSAGKSIEDMNRHQKAALKDLYGMDDAMMKAAFSAENAGMSMEDIRAASEGNQDAQMSEKEVMLELAKAIKKMTEGGDGMKSFFDAFAKGFRKGAIEGSKFREVFANIRKSLRVFHQFGKQVGKIMGKLIKDMGLTSSLKKLFDPKGFRDLFGLPSGNSGLLGVFKKFKDSITGKGDYSPAQMWEDMKTEFGKFFTGKGEALKILQGFVESLIRGIGKTVAFMMKFLANGLKDGLLYLVGVMRGEKQIISDGLSEGIGGAFKDAFRSLFAGIVESWKIVKPALLEFLNVLWAKVKPPMMKILETAFKYLIMKAIVVGIAQAGAGAAVVGAFKMLAVKLGMMTAAAGGTAVIGNLGMAGAIGSLWTVVVAASAGGATMIAVAIGNALLFGTLIAVALIPLALLFMGMVKALSGADSGAVLMAIGAMTVMVFSLKTLAAVMTGMSDISAQLPAVMSVAWAMAKIMGGLGLMTLAFAYLITQTPDEAIAKAPAFFITMGIMMIAAAGAAKIALVLQPLAAMIGQISLGLIAIGIFAGAMGLMGVGLVKMLNGAGTPEQLSAAAKFFAGFGLFMGVMGVMVPVAATVGALVIASWGIGAVVMLAGLAAIVAFGSFVIDQIIPVIEKLNSIKIANPANFKMKMEGLMSVLGGIGSMVDSVARLMSAAAGNMFQHIGQSSMAENIRAMQDLMDKLINENIGGLITKMEKFAQDAQGLDKQSIAAISAMGALLKAVGSIVGAMAPSDAAVQAAAKVEEEAWVAGAGDVLTAAADFANKMLPIMEAAFKHMKDLITFLSTHLKGMDFSKVGPLVQAIPGMLSGAGSMMKAMQPDGKAWEAVKEAADTYGEDSVKTVNAISRMSRNIARQMGPVLRSVGGMMKSVIGALIPLVRIVASSKVDPKVMKGLSSIIGRVLTSTSELMGSLHPILKTMADTPGSWASLQKQFKKITETLVATFKAVVPLVGNLIKQVTKAINRISVTDPKAFSSKLKVIRGAFDILKMITSMFAGTKGVFSDFVGGKKERVVNLKGEDMSNLQVVVLNIERVMFRLFKSGLMKRLLESIGGVDIPKGLRGRLRVVGSAFKEALTTLGFLKELGNMFGKSDPKSAFSTFINAGKKLPRSRDGRQMSGMQVMAANIKAMIRVLFGGGSGESVMGKLLLAMAGVTVNYKDAMKLTRVGKMMKSASEVLSTIGEVGKLTGSGSIFDSTPGSAKPWHASSLDQTYDSIANLIASFFGVSVPLTSGEWSKITVKGGIMNALMIGMKGVGANYKDAGKLKVLGSTMKQAGIVIREMAGVTNMLNDVSKIKMAENAGTAIVSIVDNINETNTALSKLNAVNMNTVIGKFAKVLGVTTDKVTVKRGEVNVTVNLQVHMSAEKLSKALITETVVGKGNALQPAASP